MARGRHTALQITLSAADHATLVLWQQSTTMPAGLQRRGMVIALLAYGHTITDTARWVGLSRRHTYKWIKRFQASGLAGLRDQPRQRSQKEP